ncbi:Coatomer subunit epsilon-2 (Epsilon-coat protein 2) (Epsilon-COP 2) [Durusdinium trenchii]|uniref:Coatomer subunit epsilon-2 (Epsilon-coat protein 2) (Epsilon-COP 2) n=1 Tax=Durusdinium trenchii TaxID=1381693 RepID=A0ABP0JG49_9DINO
MRNPVWELEPSDLEEEEEEEEEEGEEGVARGRAGKRSREGKKKKKKKEKRKEGRSRRSREREEKKRRRRKRKRRKKGKKRSKEDAGSESAESQSTSSSSSGSASEEAKSESESSAESSRAKRKAIAGPALPQRANVAGAAAATVAGGAAGAAPAEVNYGKALRQGEGAAIAQFVAKDMRIPRRGEVGLSGDAIEEFEKLGYVMSGSRHKRMNAVRLRKENQVLTAEERQAMTLARYEEKLQREEKLMAEFQAVVAEKEREAKAKGARRQSVVDSAGAMDVDELYSVRNLFWLGNYAAAIDEAQELVPSNEREQIDRDVFVFRSLIGQGNARQEDMNKLTDCDDPMPYLSRLKPYSKVIEQVGDQSSAPTDLLAVKMLATFLSQPAQREALLETIKDWLSDETIRDNQTLQLMAGLMFFQAGDTKEALRALRSRSNLEILALSVQIYISMNRVDLAQKELEELQRLDDDCTLTQLATAWVHLANGSSKAQEAAYIYQEQMDKTVASAALLNGLGVANMQLKKFGEAAKSLEEAHQKDPSNVDVLVNLISCYINDRKPAKQVDQAVSKLRMAAPSHPLLAQLAACASAFDAKAAALAT